MAKKKFVNFIAEIKHLLMIITIKIKARTATDNNSGEEDETL